MSDTTKKTGGCHCGKVRYEATGAFDSAISCNCSMCGKKGSLLAFVGDDQFRLLAGEGELTDYLFNKHVIHHTFCKTCGVTSFARGTGPDGKKMVAINVRCLDDVDLEKVAIHAYDGRSK